MLLSVLERVLLSQALPAQGSFTNLKLLREAREMLSFTEEENKELQFIQDSEQLRWKGFKIVNKATGKVLEGSPEFIEKMVEKSSELFEQVLTVENKEFEFGEVITSLVVKALKELDKQEKLTNDHVPLYEKFIDEESGKD